MSLGPTKKPPPSSDYARDIAARGLKAVEERRAANQYSPTTARQGLDYTYQTGRSTHPQSAVFDEWLANSTPQGYDVSFGRGDGKYAGFETEGELKAAVLGRAQQLRASDQSVFDRLYSNADERLGQVEGDYRSGQWGNRTNSISRAQQMLDAENLRRQQALRHSPRTHLGNDPAFAGEPGISEQSANDMLSSPQLNPGQAGFFTGDQQLNLRQLGLTDSNSSGVGYSSAGADGAGGSDYSAQAHGGPAGTFAGARRSEDNRMIDQVVAPARQDESVYAKQLNDWLANASDQYLGQQEFAQQGLNAPLSLYGKQAGAEYGIDPNILGGWYDPSTDNAYFNDTRDQQSIAETGLPYSERQSALDDFQTQQDQAAQQQTAAQEQALNDQIMQATGQDGGQLATAANLTPQQLASYVLDPTFQDAVNDPALADALDSGDPATITETVNQVLAGLPPDPVYRNIFRALFPGAGGSSTI